MMTAAATLAPRPLDPNSIALTHHVPHGHRAAFTTDIREAGLAPWATAMPGSVYLCTLPAWVVTLHDALVRVVKAPIGFTHYVMSRCGELDPAKRESFASAVASLVLLEPRASTAIVELFDMLLDRDTG